jgi:hypothetical protein
LTSEFCGDGVVTGELLLAAPELIMSFDILTPEIDGIPFFPGT